LDKFGLPIRFSLSVSMKMLAAIRSSGEGDDGGLVRR
jgi:hypothetical protein